MVILPLLIQFKGGYPDIEFVKKTGGFFEEAVGR